MKKKTTALLLVTALLITGCGTKEKDNVSSQNRIEKGESQKWTESIELSEGDNRIPILSVTEGLQEQLEERGTKDAALYNQINRMVTVHELWGTDELSYLDETTGVFYFVNKSISIAMTDAEDCFLYRIKDGETALAVAMPVKELYFYDGKLYFMVSSYDKYFLRDCSEGDIFSYEPATGTVEKLYSMEEGTLRHQLYVDETGIYFSYATPLNKLSYIEYFFSLPFGESKAVEEFRQMTMPGWSNYFFALYGTPDMEGLAPLSMLNRDDKTDVTTFGLRPKTYFVYGDNFCYTQERGQTIYVRNLISGETEGYPLDKYFADVKSHFPDYNPEMYTIIYYSVTDKYIGVSTLSELFFVNRESDTLMNYYDYREGYQFENLLTDGEHFYVFYDGKIARVLLDEENYVRDDSQTVYLPELEYLIAE